LDQYAFFKRCNKYDKAAIDVLLADRSQLGGSDRGEVEAVVQASALGATVIVDDPWGRELAEREVSIATVRFGFLRASTIWG
jgi:predicted nucleic acid-binding protein